MSVTDFTQDDGVSLVFLPNSCANTGKSTSQLLDFSALTENCQTTDAAVLVRVVLTEKITKISKKASI